MPEMPIDPPSPIAIARALSGLTAQLKDDINYERGCLEDVHAFLSEEPPNIQAARDELAKGMGHAFRQYHREERPEAWLVAACNQLLRTSPVPAA